jgi:GTP-binding protein EngB required for normal cell division
MGSSESKRQLENFETKTICETVNEIGKSNFEQNIYVTGNYDLQFFVKNIVEIPRNPFISETTSYIKMSRHIQISEWHYFFAPKTENFDEIKKNTLNFCEDHYEEDPDDFLENKQTRQEKITILYFIDNNTDNFVNLFLKEYNQKKIPFIIFIGKEEETTQLKTKINQLIKTLKKEIDSNLFKYCYFNDDLENCLIQLTINLIECASFFNELGDEFKFPKKLVDDDVMENNLNSFLKSIFSFNIIVLGRPGVGKSSFINKMINAMICKSGMGGECSSRIIKYLHRIFPITFFDTPGISTENIVEKVLKLIREKNTELNGNRSRFHAVFYILDGNNARSFMDYEEKMFKCLLEELKLPVYFILTKLESKEKGDENLPFMIKNFNRVTKGLNINRDYKSQKTIKKNIFYVNVLGEHIMGIDKLFAKLYDDFRGYIMDEEIKLDNIERITQQSLIGTINNPFEIASHPKSVCEYINSMYRLIGRSIGSKEKGSTNLSAAFLKQIYNVYGYNNIRLIELKRKIESEGFQLDKKKITQNKEFKSWWITRKHNGYQTQAEEEIDYLNCHYSQVLHDQLCKDQSLCLKYINKLRESMNNAINGFKEISELNKT